eukprot:16634-Heterococcus_DN1.PRE.2
MTHAVVDGKTRSRYIECTYHCVFAQCENMQAAYAKKQGRSESAGSRTPEACAIGTSSQQLQRLATERGEQRC